MGRYKHLIGPRLRARSLPAQQAEVTITVEALPTMIPGKPRLCPGCLDTAREGAAQPYAGPGNNTVPNDDEAAATAA